MPIHRALGFGGEPCRNGERWRWGDVEFLVINGTGQSEDRRNDDSCAAVPSSAIVIPGRISHANMIGRLTGARLMRRCSFCPTR